MSDDRRLRVEELFDAALDRDPADREAWLREQCGGDEDLFDEVGDLLRSLEGASGFLSRSAIEESPGLIRAVDPFIGEMVGPYRVREHIGSGGMGSVYLAEREDDVFHRCVAIKLIHSGFGRGEVLERFRRERRLLANLDHPNIAKLIDGGTLADGSPYFIMEYIEGKPIDAYCDEHGLSVEQRIELFRTICDAVSHAHRNLIIHRDLKPANILVTHDGVVKLLDFGIAKVLDSEHAAYESTLTVERRLTPAYASPEQIRGEQVTTASDVYSLGVILYELLTGTRPYQLESGSWKELEQAICEATPTRPSSVVSKTITSCDGATTLTPQQVSERRGVDPARLRQQLSGDLEWIILMALRKEPDRRYATVEQLSEDLRRIGASLPVQARPDTFGYLASRFVQRNRAAVAWAAALGIGLIVATVVSVDLALRESAAREVAEQRRVESEQERSRAVEAERQAQRRAEELEQVTAYQSELFSMIRIGRMGDRIREGIIDSARIGATIRGFEPDRIEAELPRDARRRSGEYRLIQTGPREPSAERRGGDGGGWDAYSGGGSVGGGAGSVCEASRRYRPEHPGDAQHSR